MATVFKSADRDFQATPNRIDPYRIVSDYSIINKGLKPENLNFDLRRLDPGQYSAVYHFHRHSEELFMIVSGTAILRTPEGLQVVEPGDLLFFEMGESGAHQLFNHTDQPCVFLDVRTFTGQDVAEYPDSNKILLVPSMEIFDKAAQKGYFEGEENVQEKWRELQHNK